VRRHHNNDGRRQIQQGKTRQDAERLAEKYVHKMSSDETIDSRSHATCVLRRRKGQDGRRYGTIELKRSDLLRICRNEYVRNEAEKLILRNTEQEPAE
jgi:hypothetical protein